MDYSNYNNVLGMRESSNKYDAVNQLGYMGRFQMGSAALQDLGYMNAIPKGMNQKNWINNRGAWTGKDGVSDLQGFLANHKLQDQVQNQWNTVLDKRTQHFGLDKYVGQNIGGVDVTADGIRAASHLLGHGAVMKALGNGDLNSAVDGNGVSIAKYMGLYPSQQSILPSQEQATPVPQKEQSVVPQRATQMFNTEPEQPMLVASNTPRSLNMFQEYFNKYKPF